MLYFEFVLSVLEMIYYLYLIQNKLDINMSKISKIN